jgi:dTDP-L-rhamnose 4-epimerase
VRVLVTGGCGFVGSHVVDALAAAGHAPVVLDRVEPRHPNAEAEYLRGDVRDERACERGLRGADAVSHQAARVGLGLRFADVADYVEDNDLGTATLLRVMDDQGFAGRLVLASSMVVYGEGAYRCESCGVVHPGARRESNMSAARFEQVCPACRAQVRPLPLDEDERLSPRNVYAATKLHQEHLCFTYGHVTSAPVLALRYHNVYGPRSPLDTPYAGVASLFLGALSRGEAPRVFEDGHQLRDFVHVRDVAQANLAALQADAATIGPFNVSSGQPRSLLELADALWKTSGGTAPQPVVTGEWRKGDVRHVFASNERARTALGFEAGISFEKGMADLARDHHIHGASRV